MRGRYDKVKGSAVNPVLRQGNSDRRAPASVKEYARQHPHSMGEWSSESKSHVSTMSEDDFRSTERSHTIEREGAVRIEHVDPDGNVTVLKEEIAVKAGEIIDAAVMRRAALRGVPGRADRRRQAARRPVLGPPEDHDDAGGRPDHLRARRPGLLQGRLRGARRRAEVGRGRTPTTGCGALLKAIEELPDEQRKEVERAIEKAYEDGPPLAMVDSDRGITNLHVPSDVIIDASMPAAIRSSGQMWNADGEQQDAKFVIPDHSYAALYAEAVDALQQHGAFDPGKMGSTPNIGLMAQSAEEYGSHDKTFEIADTGSRPGRRRRRRNAVRARG